MKAQHVILSLMTLAATVGNSVKADVSPRFDLTTEAPRGLFTPAKGKPTGEKGAATSMLDSLCAIAGRSTRIPCPRPLSYTPSRLGFTADLPHLRLNIIVREMQNIVVSGAGVDSAGFGQEPWVFWQIQSQAADVSIPDPSGETPYNALPAPPPGDTWDVPHANGLYQGIIEHGCVGAPGATFDVTLDSWVARLTDNVSMGSVHLTDDVQGHGYYTFSYTLRATDDAGNVSDFVISGDANAFCVGKPHFDS